MQVKKQHESLIQKNFSLAPLTSWQIGGVADFYAEPGTLEDLTDIYTSYQSSPITILSGGSNVLVSDKGIRGLVIGLRKFNKIQYEQVAGRLQLTCDSGCGKNELLKIFLKNQLAPALFLAGIPGDVGGGVVMNAGISQSFEPREFDQITDWFEVLKPDGSVKKYLKQDVQWHYRHSEGWQPGLITRVGLSWPLEAKPDILTQVRDANKHRNHTQPLDKPSCGSVFKNPDPGLTNLKSAQLIEKCGLKGHQIGQAQVSLKHANFIVNLGGATAADTWSVIQHVKKTVLEKEKIELSTEVIQLGDWS